MSAVWGNAERKPMRRGAWPWARSPGNSPSRAPPARATNVRRLTIESPRRQMSRTAIVRRAVWLQSRVAPTYVRATWTVTLTVRNWPDTSRSPLVCRLTTKVTRPRKRREATLERVGVHRYVRAHSRLLKAHFVRHPANEHGTACRPADFAPSTFSTRSSKNIIEPNGTPSAYAICSKACFSGFR